MMNYPNNNYMVNSQAILPPTMNPSYKAFLDNFVKQHLILIDSSVAMKESFPLLLRDLILPLKQNSKSIVVLQAVMEQLNKLSKSSDPTKSAKALKALSDIHFLNANNLAVFKGRPNTGASANTEIMRFVSSYLFGDGNENIAVLTQSADLNNDCKVFSQLKSCTINHSVSVKRIGNENGKLKSFTNPESGAATQTVGQDSFSITQVYKTLGL